MSLLTHAILFSRIYLLFILIPIASAQDGIAQETIVQEPGDYRTNNYNTNVPMTVNGAKVIKTANQLAEFLRANKAAVLVDVYPAPRKPDNLPHSELWIEPTRTTLPKTVWLANTGLGALPPDLTQLFNQQLQQLATHHKNLIVIIFCEPRCWHSWNSVKRAVSLGYTNVYWYREGVAGWKEASFSLIKTQPKRP